MTGFQSKRAMAADRMTEHMDIDAVNAELAEIAEQEREAAVNAEYEELLNELDLQKQYEMRSYEYDMEFYGYRGVS